MKKFILIFFVIFFFNISYSQKTIDKKENLNAISFGWSNPVSLTQSVFESDSIEKIGFYLDYSLKIDSIKFVRFHIKNSPFIENNKLTLSNFLSSIDYIKLILTKNKVVLGHGLGFYFRCNIYRSQVSNGLRTVWSSDYFGAGIQYHIFIDYFIRKDLSLNIITHLNFGLHQFYGNTINNGNYSQEYWEPKFENQQLISLGIKKTF